MTSKFPRSILAAAILFATSALAQTSSTPASASPTTVASSAAPATTPSATSAEAALKVGTINIQDAIFLSNEGRKEMEALQKKFDPKQTELKSQNDELEALKKQLNTQASSLNDDALANLKKQIEGKQKTFDRNVQDAQEDFGNQQQEIASRILSKMAPLIVKYSQDNGFGLIIDTSKPWPQSPILWWNQDAVDITKPVIEKYNVQSGVPAPAGGTKPPVPKPAVPKTAAPQTTTPPK
jgi:outer membrane protein